MRTSTLAVRCLDSLFGLHDVTLNAAILSAYSFRPRNPIIRFDELNGPMQLNSQLITMHKDIRASLKEAINILECASLC
jgi:hypothetical protein